MKNRKLLLIFLFLVTLVNGYIKSNYCDEDFLQIHNEKKIQGDISHCHYTEFQKRDYRGFKGEPECFDEKSNRIFTPDICVIDFAELKQNVSYCDNVSRMSVSTGYEHYYTADKCFVKIRNLIKEPQKCEKTKDDSCLAYVAKITNNLEMCKTIKRQWQNGLDCLTPIAISRKNVSICYYFNEKPFWDLDSEWCIRYYADGTNEDWGTCLNVSNLDMKNICLKNLIPQSKNEILCDIYVKGCISNKECKLKSSGTFVGASEGKSIREECQHITDNILIMLTNPLQDQLLNGTTKTYLIGNKGYEIEIYDIRPYYSKDNLDSASLRVNEEIIRHYPLNQEYELVDGTKLILASTYLEGNKAGISFILGKIP